MRHKIRIKEIRKVKRISQKELANIVGLSQSRLSDIENMRCDIQLIKFLQIAEVLDVHPGQLVDIYPSEKDSI